MKADMPNRRLVAHSTCLFLLSWSPHAITSISDATHSYRLAEDIIRANACTPSNRHRIAYEMPVIVNGAAT